MNIVKKLFYNYLINRKIGDNDNTLSTNKHKKLDIVISINFTGDINQLELLNHLVQVFSPMEKAKMELTYVIEEPSEKSLKIKSRGGVMNSKTLANFENKIKSKIMKDVCSCFGDLKWAPINEEYSVLIANIMLNAGLAVAFNIVKYDAFFDSII